MDTEKRLYEAAVEGNVKVLQELLQQDALILDRLTLTCFNETPLHIAALRGHVEFVRLILAQNPQLAAELDSRKSSPLHIASAKGHLQIVKMLLLVNPELCLARDRDGGNPLHLAAIKGRVEVVKELLHVRPRAALGTMIDGENVLHLCVKHNQLEVLKVLMEIGWDHEFLNAKDGNGHNILHLAVADKQIETVKYLLKTHHIGVNAMDANGNTTLDILAQSRRGVNDLSIGECLREAGGLRAKDMSVSIMQNSPKIPNGNSHSPVSSAPAYLGGNQAEKPPSKGDWLSKKRETIMVVASLIATMAFQAGVNPPGGVWQENKLDDQGKLLHKAGEAVMAYNHAKPYRYFLRVNTIAFVSSLSTILLLISGLPFKRRLFMWGLMVIMWLTVTSVALTYGLSIYILTPRKDRESLGQIIDIGITVWCGLMALLLLGNTIRLLRIWQKKKHEIRSAAVQKFVNSVHVNV